MLDLYLYTDDAMVNNLVTLMKIRHFYFNKIKTKRNNIWAEFELFLKFFQYIFNIYEIMKHQSGVMSLQTYFYVTLNDSCNAVP